MTVSAARAGSITLEGVRAAFARFEPSAAAGSPAWLRERRRQAVDRFVERGLPTAKDEAWRYTSLAPLEDAHLQLLPDLVVDAVADEALAAFDPDGLPGIRLVFVDGRYSAKLSSSRPLPGGARAGSLAEALVTDSDTLRAELGGGAPEMDGAFPALNAAFWQDGAFLRVPAGVVLEEPIHLLFVATRSTAGASVHVRNLVVLERAAQASLIESYVSLVDGAQLTNTVTEVAAAEGAGLGHCRIQREATTAFHMGHTEFRQARDSRIRSCGIVFGGRLTRHDLRVRLGGEGASADLCGLAVLGGRQHLDTHTVVDHRSPHGTSRQLYKGVLDGRSRSVFDGRIIVRPGAQKTDAYQTNKNLLLSEGVEVDSKPQLEIFADDVKCSHGAADGQLAGDALFYLASRGLGEAAARMLLTLGFAREVLGHVEPEPVRAELEALLMARLRDGRVAEERR